MAQKQPQLAIIGGGPAGITAGLYAARNGVETIIFEKNSFGGELAQIIQIDNYPGYSGNGQALAGKMREQAEQAGVKFQYGECTRVKKQQDGSFSILVDDEEVIARVVLIAVGNEPRRLELSDIKVPVSYCSLCDAPLTKNKNIIVIGGGNSAIQEALSLAKIARQVTIVTRSRIKALSSITERLKHANNIQVEEGTSITSEIVNQYDHVFVFIGHRPATDFLPAEILASNGTIMTGASCKDLEGSLDLLGLSGLERRASHETLISGIFAAGDVRFGATRQVVTATGDGAMAAIEIAEYLDKNV